MIWFLRSVYASYRDLNKRTEFIFTTIHNYKSEILFVPLSCETSFIAKMETQVCKNLYKIVV